MLQKSIIPFWKWQSKPSDIGYAAGRGRGGGGHGGQVSLVPWNRQKIGHAIGQKQAPPVARLSLIHI